MALLILSFSFTAELQGYLYEFQNGGEGGYGQMLGGGVCVNMRKAQNYIKKI